MKHALLIVVLFLTACGQLDKQKALELAELSSRPFLSDAITPAEQEPLKLNPLLKYDNAEEALMGMDEERRVYRKIIKTMDVEVNARIQETNSLLRALKASEVEQRATERMYIRSKYALEDEKQSSFWTDVMHRATEVLLFGLFIIK